MSEDVPIFKIEVTAIEKVIAQNEELRTKFQKAKEWNQLCEIQLKNLQSIVEDQKMLCARAADALQSIPIVLTPPHRDLVAKLRKASE